MSRKTKGTPQGANQKSALRDITGGPVVTTFPSKAKGAGLIPGQGALRNLIKT